MREYVGPFNYPPAIVLFFEWSLGISILALAAFLMWMNWKYPCEPESLDRDEDDPQWKHMLPNTAPTRLAQCPYCGSLRVSLYGFRDLHCFSCQRWLTRYEAFGGLSQRFLEGLRALASSFTDSEDGWLMLLANLNNSSLEEARETFKYYISQIPEEILGQAVGAKPA